MQRETTENLGVWGELPVGPYGSESSVNGKGMEWRLQRGKGRPTQHVQSMKGDWTQPKSCGELLTGIEQGGRIL